jgi:hypothetical protein
MAEDPLTWLQGWYLAQCNGDWEHQQGVKISTLDNPGWRLVVDLLDTPLEGRPFITVSIERSEHDWLHCQREGNSFTAACGPRNLTEAIECFRAWAAGQTLRS